jgi:hypothetical protein
MGPPGGGSTTAQAVARTTLTAKANQIDCLKAGPGIRLPEIFLMKSSYPMSVAMMARWACIRFSASSNTTE